MTRGKVSPHPEWRLIVEALRRRDYGVQIPHAEMATITGLPERSPRYFNQVKRARTVLLTEHDKWLAVDRGAGYRLVVPSEFFGQGRRQLKFAARRLRIGAAIHGHAPQHRLSDAENAANANALAKMGALQIHTDRVLKQTKPPKLPATKPDTPKLLKS